jgi:hypothetical protein
MSNSGCVLYLAITVTACVAGAGIAAWYLNMCLSCRLPHFDYLRRVFYNSFVNILFWVVMYPWPVK